MAHLHDFETISTIGSGAYGTCYKIRKKSTGQFYVWKTINYGSLTADKKKLLVSEVNLLSELNHPHIVRYYDRVIDKNSSTLYIIMEWCEGGDLATLIAKCRKKNLILEESFIWRVLYQTSCALHACHSRFSKGPILHRDIKPANIFLDSSNNVKLGDFGLARIMNNDSTCAQTFVGTPYYMSPEIVTGGAYDKKTDIWALGCLIYELCSLCPPFTGVNIKELIQKICSGRFGRVPSDYSDELRNIISLMLTVNRNLRPTIEVIIYHPLVVSNVAKDVWSSRQSCPESSCSNLSNEKTLETHFPKANTPVTSEGETHSSTNDAASDQKSLKSVENDFYFEDLSKMQEMLLQKFDTLKLRESNVRAKELLLDEREKVIEKREKALNLLDKFTRDKLVRTEACRRSIRDRSISESSKRLLPLRRTSFVGSDSSFSADPGDTSMLPTTVKLKPQKVQRPFQHIPFERKVHFEGGKDLNMQKYNLIQNNENILVEEATNIDLNRKQINLCDYDISNTQKYGEAKGVLNDSTKTYSLFENRNVETVQHNKAVRQNVYNHTITTINEDSIQENKENLNRTELKSWVGPERGCLSNGNQLCNHKNYGLVDVDYWKANHKTLPQPNKKKIEPVKLSSLTKKIGSVVGLR